MNNRERIRKITRRKLRQIDRYFRKEDSSLAKVLDSFSASKGEAYLHSWKKRVFIDIGVGGLLAVGATPVIALLASIKFCEDKHFPFFIHKRVSPSGKIQSVWKIRTMRPNADNGSQFHALDKKPEDDPRVTNFGRWLRASGWLDELPQLWQVVLGDLTLIGIRITSQNRINDLRRDEVAESEKVVPAWPEEKFSQWQNAYRKMMDGALSGPNQVLRFRKNKFDKKRFRADIEYVERASLATDVFWIWQTVVKVLKGN